MMLSGECRTGMRSNAIWMSTHINNNTTYVFSHMPEHMS